MDELQHMTGSRAHLPSESDRDDFAYWSEVEAESLGWQPLGQGAYLHVGAPEAPDDEEVVITVTGVSDAGMLGLNVLLLV